MEYLIKVSAIVAIFYFCYSLFLQRDTFFESNRWFLLIGLITAFCIPFIVIPKYIVQSSTPIQEFLFVEGSATTNNIDNTIDVMQIISVVYIIGLIFFLGRFLIQLYSLSLLLFQNKKQQYRHYTFVEISNNLSPFSFFKWIVYNPNQFSKTELKQVLTHEKVHARQWHSIDIIISQLTSIILWFNPFIWLYKKNLQQNLEFIADHTAHQKSNCKKSYQHLLLKTSLPNYQMALTNNFYNSLIKKRIIMLHKSKSNKLKAWKYILILPVLALFIMSFNTKEIITYDKSIVTNETPEAIGDIIEVIISKDSKGADFKKAKEKFAKLGVILKFKNIKRNKKGEIIEIKSEFKTPEGHSGNLGRNGSKPISPFTFYYNLENGEVGYGSPSTIHFNESYVYTTKKGKPKIHKSGKGSNVFVYSSSDDKHDGEHEVIEDDDKIIIKSGNKIHEIKKVHTDKNVFVISGDTLEIEKLDGEIIELEADTIHFKGNIVTKEHNHKDGNIKIWTGDDDKIYELKTTGKKGNNKFFISNSDGKKPMFILDGKEITTENMDDIDPNTIESINVLKGTAAKKLYGNKGKDGVVVITTKKE